MKNIWIINHSSLPPKFGGLNRHHYFAKYLSEAGCNVKLITASAIHNTDINMIPKKVTAKIKTEIINGIEYTYLKTSSYRSNGFSRIRNLIQFPIMLRRTYKTFDKPDVIIASSPSPFSALSATVIAKKLNVPLILEVRDLWPETIVVLKGLSRKSPIIKLMYYLERYLLINADRIIFTFQGGLDYIKDRSLENKIETSKIFNINNGVDLEEFKANRQLGFNDADLLNSDIFKVIYTGSIRLSYGLDRLLDAAKILQKTHSNIKILMWGDGNERISLINRCAREEINNIVFKGHVERKNIPAILSHASACLIFVNPLSSEALGKYGSSNNKMFDYLASGKPIITNYSSKYDIINENKCGVLTKTSSAQDIANAIAHVFEMPQDVYEKQCNNALDTSKKYDYKKLTQDLIEIIKPLLNNRRL